MAVISFDLETTSLSPYSGGRIFSYSLCWEDGEVEVLRVDNPEPKKNRLNWGYAQELFNDTTLEKACHNTKFELSFLLNSRLSIPGETVWHDTMIMSQLLRNLAPSHALDNLCWEFGGYPRDLDKKVKAAADAFGNYQRVPKPLMHKYQIADAERGMLLYQFFWPKILAEGPELVNDYWNEIELIKTTQRLEQYGVMVGEENATELLRWLVKEFDRVQNECHVYLGEYVNLNSAIQLVNLLYHVKRFPILKLTKKKKPSTDKDVLLALRERFNDPLFDMIFRWRSYSTGITTVEKYLKLRDRNGIIHPNIKTNHARTGRESSSEPNMQNVAKDAVLKNPFAVPARRAFCTRPEHLLYLVDYSGIEMRLIIDRSEEEPLIKLLKEDGDPHKEAAIQFYGKRFLEADSKQQGILRGAAKNAQFALAYGAGLSKIANTLMLSTMEAQPGFQAYSRRFPKVANFTNTIAAQVRETGYVMTPFGRKLGVPLDKAYIGTNYLIQGTAAGILKRAQVRVDKYLKETWQDEIRLVLPIHDELIISYPRRLLKYKTQILGTIVSLMTTMPEIVVPLEVEWKVTNSTWDKAWKIGQTPAVDLGESGLDEEAIEYFQEVA